jgi:hypothetical protein
MVTRQKDITVENYQVRLQAEEGSNVPGKEWVSWFAIVGLSAPNVAIGTTGNVVTHAKT